MAQAIPRMIPLLVATIAAEFLSVAGVQLVVRTGPMHAHVDVPRTGEIIGHTVLSYLESRASNPPDVLVIGNDDTVRWKKDGLGPDTVI